MSWVDVANSTMIFVILAVSLNLLLGTTGQLSVAHGAFGAIGGYTAGYVTLRYPWGTAAAVGIGVAAALVVGVLVGLPALLLPGEYLVLLTLGLATVVVVLTRGGPALGTLPAVAASPRPDDRVLPLLLVTVAVFAAFGWIAASPFGLVLRGIREDPLTTRALGKHVGGSTVVVFAGTAAVAALGGALAGLSAGTVLAPLDGFSLSVLLVAAVVLGGRGNVIGSVLGAAVVVGPGPVFAQVLDAPAAARLWLLCVGVLLVVVLVVRPQGLLPDGAALRRRRRGRPAEAEPSVEDLATDPIRGVGAGRVGRPRPVVRVTGVRKAFGGITAVDGLSFVLPQGRVTALIGRSGAGKSTVLDVVSGVTAPDAGFVELDGEDVTGWPVDRVARRGVVRSFADVRVFAGLSVLDNVALAVPDQRGENLRGLLRPWAVVADRRRTRAAALDALEVVGLADRADRTAGELPVGEQKLVALARALAVDARVLLLDEPASGVDAEGVDRIVDVLGRLRADGVTICLVEHDLRVVERVADRVLLLEAGRIHAAGAMADLVADERLVEVYFGRP